MEKPKKPKVIGLVVLLGFFFILPGITSHTAVLHIMIWIFVYSVLCGTFRFATMTGDWSFAHVGVMAERLGLYRRNSP